jgi:putative hydrolase of the HAD superfamily
MPEAHARAAGARAVLLDLGGVLIDVRFERTLAHWATAAGLDARDLGADFTPDEAYDRLERGECDFAEFAHRLRARLDVTLDDATLLEGWNAALGEAMDGARALVEAAATRWPLYLFSNTNAAHHAHWSRAHAALLSPLREVFVSNELGARKPDPEAFRRVLSHMGLGAGEVAFFDDLAGNVRGARQAGLTAWQVAGPADVANALGLDITPGRAR